MFQNDTPGLPGDRLSHIVLKWKHPDHPAEGHVLYDAVQVGETIARQRAASRAAIVRANGSTVTKYEAHFLDGHTENWS